ncbi:hypothetical protein F2Q70_00029616 [Brassica cretica]|uniref:DUF223 domain-containing protein n=1 Tax=Brassica cretica TaxID=69181 RepID=A0A8S9GZF3_BRACR|nr:hypothetical protein F2Q70_00029616 [Brassica cretica]KAF2551951.1 hypothetical protein F2Q68_00034044 [Brassica cretica]
MAYITFLSELIPFDTKKSIRVKVLTNWNTVNGSLCNNKGMLLADAKIEPISESYFICLASFLKIKKGLSHTKFCVDLCGALVCVGEIENIEDDEAGGAPIRQIQFSLINIGFTHLKCVAYGRLAEELNDFWSSTIANTVLCVLRFWRIEWGPSGFKFITNTEVSQILFDEDIPEIQEFKKRIPKSCF